MRLHSRIKKLEQASGITESEGEMRLIIIHGGLTEEDKNYEKFPDGCPSYKFRLEKGEKRRHPGKNSIEMITLSCEGCLEDCDYALANRPLSSHPAYRGHEQTAKIPT